MISGRSIGTEPGGIRPGGDVLLLVVGICSSAGPEPLPDPRQRLREGARLAALPSGFTTAAAVTSQVKNYLTTGNVDSRSYRHHRRSRSGRRDRNGGLHHRDLSLQIWIRGARRSPHQSRRHRRSGYHHHRAERDAQRITIRCRDPSESGPSYRDAET